MEETHPMEVNITFRHSEPSIVIKQQVEDKIRGLQKYLVKPTLAHVILKVEKSRHIAEVTLLESHHKLYAQEGSHDMYRSLDLCLEKLKRQARKLKEKVKSHHAHHNRD